MWRVKLVPDIRAAVAPEIRDRIAEKQRVHAAFLRHFHETLVTGNPIRRIGAGDGIRGCVFGQRGRNQQRGNNQRGKKRELFHARSLETRKIKIKPTRLAHPQGAQLATAPKQTGKAVRSSAFRRQNAAVCANRLKAELQTEVVSSCAHPQVL